MHFKSFVAKHYFGLSHRSLKHIKNVIFPKSKQSRTKQNTIKMMRLRRLTRFLGKREVTVENCFQGQLKDITVDIIALTQFQRQLMLSKKGKKTQNNERIVNPES